MSPSTGQVITLSCRQLFPIRLAAGTRIECTHGRIWLTEEGLPRDVLLEPGEAYEISRRSLVSVQALGETIFRIRAKARLPYPTQRLAAALGRWLSAARIHPRKAIAAAAPYS